MFFFHTLKNPHPLPPSMEADEDEFGDLYTDVLPKLSFPSSQTPPSPQFNDATCDHLKPCSSPQETHSREDPARVSNPPVSEEAEISEIRVSPDAEKARVLMDERIEIGDLDSNTAIPGISAGILDASAENVGVGAKEKDEDDWDSDDDSEDDLRIVLNDAGGPMGAEMIEEEGEDLVIVADGDQHHQGIEEQEWGEEGTAALLLPGVDGERKEVGEAAKAAGGAVVGMARIGYSSHGYHHQHHSQFKVSFLDENVGFLASNVSLASFGIGKL